jgi:hypothetical protein
MSCLGGRPPSIPTATVGKRRRNTIESTTTPRLLGQPGPADFLIAAEGGDLPDGQNGKNARETQETVTDSN